MKKTIGISCLLLAISATVFVACQKAKHINNDRKKDLSAIIENIGKKYHISHAQIGDTTGHGPETGHGNPPVAEYGCPNRSCKIEHLLLADGIGALLSSPSTGSSRGYGPLWGGFGATLAVEPYFRYPPAGGGGNDNGGGNDGGGNNGSSTNIYIPEDNHDNFTYGQIGYLHNVLMKDALDLGYEATIEGGHINSNIKNLLITNNFYNVPDIADSFAYYEPMLVNNLNYQNAYIGDSSFDIDGLIANLPVNNNIKNEITTIRGQIGQIDISNISAFLLDVNGAVLNSSLPESDKEKLLVFIGVANSSCYFWGANLN